MTSPIIDNPNILRRLVFFLDMPSLRQFCYISESADHQVTEELTLSLHHLLSHFIAQPRAFLEVLRMTGAVIGGDVAVAFFMCDLSIHPSTLDIFAPIDQPYQIHDFLEFQELILPERPL